VTNRGYLPPSDDLLRELSTTGAA